MNAFAGDDSIRFGGSLVSSTVTAGAGNEDTIAISASTGADYSFLQIGVYAGVGADSVLITDGADPHCLRWTLQLQIPLVVLTP